MSPTKRTQVITGSTQVTDHAHSNPLNHARIGSEIDLDRGKVRVVRQQLHPVLLPSKALDGDVILQPGDDDLAVACLGRAVHGQQVAITDAGVTHAQPLHAQ